MVHLGRRRNGGSVLNRSAAETTETPFTGSSRTAPNHRPASSAIGLSGKLVSPDKTLDCAQDLIGYRFRDISILHQALTHASLSDSRVASNERLEFLGDAVLGTVICHELYRRFPDHLEGDLTKLKSTIVSRKTCADVADQLGLTPLIFLGKGMNTQASVPRSLRAAVLEAIVAGIFVDGGFEAAQTFILRALDGFIEQAAHSEHQDNYKSMLQQYIQKHFSLTPQYDQLDEQGPDHSKCFEVCVVVGNKRYPSAWGPSKKEAEQRAAKLALLSLNPSFDGSLIETEPIPTSNTHESHP